MEKPIAVIAFGGNAILDKGDDGSFETQLEKAKTACREMLSILHKGYDICLVHGNGPQVGNLLIQFEKARDIIPVPPLDVAVASSQGLLGHMLEVSMRSVLAEDNMEKDVACILTQVVVDSEDPSFKNPTRKILELNSIRSLLNAHNVVIACGGGGIPVNYTTNSVMGTTGVIDKDRASALLAYNLDAQLYMIVTGVAKVCINYGKPDQREIEVMTVSEAKKYLAEGQFPAGSMGPKIQSAIEYVEKGGKEAIITSQDNITKCMLQPECCTRIVPD